MNFENGEIITDEIITKELREGYKKQKPRKFWSALVMGLLTDRTTKKLISIEEKHFLLNLPRAKEFNIQEGEKIIPLLKESKNKIFNRPLPFPIIFINESIELDDIIIFGTLLFQVKKSKENDDYYYIEKNFDEETTIQIFYYYFFKKDVDGLFTSFFLLNDKRPLLIDGKTLKNIKDIEKKNKKMDLFVCNFLDFLNQPEVHLVEVHTDPRQNEKRIRRGKSPHAPIKTTVRVEHFIKKYLSPFRHTIHSPYGYRFWVRGHFRQLSSPRYKEKRGIRLWIPPYTKGEGILVNKDYKVESGDE